MLSQQNLEAFAAKMGLGTDQHSLVQALQSISCPPGQLLLWISNPAAITEPYLSAIVDSIADVVEESDDGVGVAFVGTTGVTRVVTVSKDDGDTGGSNEPVVPPVVEPIVEPSGDEEGAEEGTEEGAEELVEDLAAGTDTAADDEEPAAE